MDYYQGMLRCSWKNGIPIYVFTVDYKRKVLITTQCNKVEPRSNKGAEYIYTFYSKEPDLLGEMTASTSFELCPHGTKTIETRFVLCANGDNVEGYTHTSEQTREKNKGSSKFGNIFKGHSYKRMFSALQEHILEPKLELASIVVKDHIRESGKEVEIGGWGLKFLKRDRHYESCMQSTSRCSSSMTVLVPAGLHEGPKTRSGGGPSSLIERWRSGGSCDCGGWDLGCPLTVLHAKPNNQDGIFGKSFPFDLFVQGCKKTEPVLNMVEVHDGLYNIRDQEGIVKVRKVNGVKGKERKIERLAYVLESEEMRGPSFLLYHSKICD